VGASLALAASLLGSALRETLPPTSEPAWWAVDREADAAYVLDENLILARCVRVRRPVEVCATRDGGAWILAGSGASRKGRSLLRLRADGSRATAIALGSSAALSVLEDDDALVVDDGCRLVRCGQEGEARILLEGRDLACAAAHGSAVLVGSRSGEIFRLRAGGLECARLAAPILDLESVGPSVYVLFGDPPRIGRLLPDLSLRWETACEPGCTGIAAAEDGGAWIVDDGASRLRRLARDGSIGFERAGLAGAAALAGAGDGSVVLALPGALLRIDARGKNRRGQGGFVFLSDVDRIRRNR